MFSQSGLVYTEDEWQKEWNELIKLASSEPRVHYGPNGSACAGYVQGSTYQIPVTRHKPRPVPSLGAQLRDEGPKPKLGFPQRSLCFAGALSPQTSRLNAIFEAL